MNMLEIMKQAKQMQGMMKQTQQMLAETKVEATAGGGMVTVAMNGQKRILRMTIDPEVVSQNDVEMLQDLIVAAVNDAQSKVDEAISGKMGGMMGGLKIPGLTG
jgi:DNA-binding YbaB/EbfC family protein